MPLRLAVVVPTLEEEAALRARLPGVVALADEVVVSDGGSRDATREVAAALGATVVVGPPGRGGQLNRGAAAASADVLLFLHADTTLAPEAPAAVRAAVAAGHDGGAFLVRFDAEGLVYRFGAAVVNARTRRWRTALGDQAQFVTVEMFQRLGGYRDWPILEDLDFARRLKRHGRVAMVDAPVTTAARRYLQGGIVATAARNWLIWGLFACGVSPRRLARLYRRSR